MKKNSGLKVLIIILIILIVVCGVLIALKILKDKNIQIANSKNIISLETEEVQIKQEEPIKIYNGKDRPIAVMIDNHKGAWPHAGIKDAYMVYEIIVEGGETRLMALFKGKDLEKIGPIRSSRHYFLDYALENDAIYVHFGWSPQAESDISTLGVNNINGLVESQTSFWRVKDKKAPHNAVTSTRKILEIANRKNYRTTSNYESVLNYVADEVVLEDGDVANEITIPYTDKNIVSYKYDEEAKRYERYSKGVKQTDWDTKETITAKNIIITFAKNYTLKDSENKDRQGLNNIGTLDGYYITNGKAIKITCAKESRKTQTVYKDLEGNEIKVNDGNTFVQICPIDANVIIK